MMNPIWNDTVSGDELRRRQAEIDQAMLGVIADARRSNPNAHELPIKVLPVGAAEAKVGAEAPRRGWAEEVPLSLPPGQDAIERLVKRGAAAWSRVWAQALRRRAEP
jgi:hypothetical protein